MGHLCTAKVTITDALRCLSAGANRASSHLFAPLILLIMVQGYPLRNCTAL